MLLGTRVKLNHPNWYNIILAIKKCQSEGVSMAVAAKKIGVSVQTARKWSKIDEAGFEALKRDDIPYMDQYREFILSMARSMH